MYLTMKPLITYHTGKKLSFTFSTCFCIAFSTHVTFILYFPPGNKSPSENVSSDEEFCFGDEDIRLAQLELTSPESIEQADDGSGKLYCYRFLLSRDKVIWLTMLNTGMLHHNIIS